MKSEVVEYLSECSECQHVKVEHQNPVVLSNPVLIAEWKLEVISLDFITRLQKIMRQDDSIMLVVDILCKEINFIPIKSTYGTIQIANVFKKEILLSDKVAKFTSKFWKALLGGVGTHLNFSIAYHTQNNGKT